MTAAASLWIAFSSVVAPVQAASEAERLQRLEMLADIWGKIYLFHPRVVSGQLDWNRALIEAIPKVEAATGTDELVSALNETLFRLLDDPFTGVQPIGQTAEAPPSRRLSARMLSTTVGYIDATDPRQYGVDPARTFSDLILGLSKVDTLVVDLRFVTPGSARMDWLGLFLDAPQTTGPMVNRVHHGWNENNSGGPYRQAWGVRPGSTVRSAARGGLHTPVMFVVNNASYYRAAPVLDVLQSIGRAVVVWERRGRLATPELPQTGGDINPERYPTNIELHLNTSMLVSKSGGLGPTADYSTATALADADLPVIAGKLFAGRSEAPKKHPHPFSFEMTFPAMDAASGTPLSRELKLLYLFKIWIVNSYMNLNLEHASITWPKCLPEWIPKVEQTGDDTGYYTTLRVLTAKLNDSHVSFPINANDGASRLPVEIRFVEGKPLVVSKLKIAAGEGSPLRVGDEILAVDGRSVEDRFTERRPLISASTTGSLMRTLAGGLAFTKDKEMIEVRVRNAEGDRTVAVRTIRSDAPLTREPSYKVLEEGFGYINLDTFTNAEMEPVLSAITASKGLILDMRGYPRFNQTTFLSRLIDKPLPANILESPIVSGPMLPVPEKAEFSQDWVQPADGPRYTRPIVVLIDDRAQSSAEHFCMNLRNGKRATFVGSTTAGTNGVIARIGLPAGRTLSFTGMRMKFGDGSRFQNIGIIPDVKAEPTVDGVRAGLDEVLEKGIETLRAAVSR